MEVVIFILLVLLVAVVWLVCENNPQNSDNYADNTPRFNKDIRPLFRDKDINSMKRMGIDLSSYSDVKENADKIYKRVSKGDMPCDGPWSQDKVDLFRRWLESGMRQ